MLRLFRHYIGYHGMVLAGCEMAVLFALLLLLAGLLGQAGLDIPVDRRPAAAALVTLAAYAGLSAVGLYDRAHLAHMRQVVSRAAVILPLIAAALIMGLGLFDLWSESGPQGGDYALAVVGLTAFFPVMLSLRGGFGRLIGRSRLMKRRVLVLGRGPRATKIERLSRELEDRTFALVGIAEAAAADALATRCLAEDVDEVVVAAAERRGLPVRALLSCRLAGIPVTDYASFWERESGQIDLDEINPGWLAYADGFNDGALRRAAKRAFDILASTLLLALSLPITLPVAVLIRLESPGPIFYRQERVGLRGQRFDILKFRSMRADAEKEGPRWAAKNDSRITRIGGFIRKVRIDEIPQAVNVLRGEMSFVGPRPERPIFVAALAEKIPYYDDRHVVKPGITGWAQINFPYGATEEDARRKLAYDLYYAKNASLFLDVIIMAQTLKVLLWNEGAR